MNQLQHLKKLKYIFDSTHNGVSIIDETGTVIVYNRSAGMMLDKDPDEMLGQFIGDVFPNAWEDLEKILKNTYGSDNPVVFKNRSSVGNYGGVAQGDFLSYFVYYAYTVVC